MDARTSVAVDAADRELVVTRILDAPRRLLDDVNFPKGNAFALQ